MTSAAGTGVARATAARPRTAVAVSDPPSLRQLFAQAQAAAKATAYPAGGEVAGTSAAQASTSAAPASPRSAAQIMAEAAYALVTVAGHQNGMAMLLHA